MLYYNKMILNGINVNKASALNKYYVLPLLVFSK